MHTFSEYLDKFARHHGFESDADMAKKLGFSRTNMSKVRNRGHASDELCLAIADTIGEDPALVMISRNAARYTGPVGDAWKRLVAGKARQLATVALLTLPGMQIQDGKIANFGNEYNSLPMVKITGIFRILMIFRMLRRQLASNFQ